MTPRRFLLRCPRPECEHKVYSLLLDGEPRPEHCGQVMVFATTFEEERFGRERGLVEVADEQA